ncbi:hypothetical protein F4778DRAFT_279397 [Xylariomycetidae sp. FL2044]|nr:hypothetical protein F4778DRAFT_279397 [Xylariomycetidae sp. FL2044]
MKVPSASSSLSRPRLSRTSAPRVRSGCDTCKKRHIRCDETKPQCVNCLKSQRPCEGATYNLSASPQSAAIGALPKQLRLDPHLFEFPDDTSDRYFREFVSLVQGKWITGTSGRGFWGVAIPQLTHTNNPLRLAATSIGALSMWYHDSGSKSLRAIPDEDSMHYNNALTYYGRCLQLQSRNQHSSMLDTTLLSLLLLLFEILRGDRKSALGHVNHGLTLFLELMTDRDIHDYTTSLAPDPRAIFSEIADVYISLTGQTRTVLHGKVGHCSPLPNFMNGLREKNYTIESFVALLLQLHTSPTTLETIPERFTSLDEFERCLNGVRQRRSSLGSALMEIARETDVLNCNNEGSVGRYYAAILDSPRIKEICDDARQQMEAIDAAFSPLFDQIVLDHTDSPMYIRAIHLRIRYLSVYLFEDAPQFLHIELMASLTPRFRELLSLAEVILRLSEEESGNLAHHLSLQSSLGCHLLLVAFFCRDALVREQAIGILRDYPAQDGLWNTQALYILALRNRQVEKANAAEGTPAEQWSRLLRREFVFDDGGERIVFRYVVKNDQNGTWELIKDTAELRGASEDVHWQRQPLTRSGRLLVGDIITPD